MPAKTSTLSDVRIEKLVYGGAGLAHHEGSTIFVPFVLPEERVTATVVEHKKKFIRADLDSVIEAAASRVVARCPHFAVCGGCHYQHMPYEAQLRYKEEILRETLRRIGQIDWPEEIHVHSAQPWGYRNRAQWKVRPVEAKGADANRMEVGYFAPNSTALVPVNDCPILAPTLLKTLLALCDAGSAGLLPRSLREVEAFATPATADAPPRLLLTATFAGFPSRSEDFIQKIATALPKCDSLLLHDPSHERMELIGPGLVEYTVGFATFRVGHFSFFQVNDFLVSKLAEEVVARAGNGKLALDLYAGVGLFTAPLAKAFTRVVTVESNPAATRDLESNTRAQGSVEVRTTDVEKFLAHYTDQSDLVVLDPPRAGLAPGVAQRLIRLAPERMIYVSCEPPTLARDLKLFRESGYKLRNVQLFDLFPQTFHIETLVELEKEP